MMPEPMTYDEFLEHLKKTLSPDEYEYVLGLYSDDSD